MRERAYKGEKGEDREELGERWFYAYRGELWWLCMLVSGGAGGSFYIIGKKGKKKEDGADVGESMCWCGMVWIESIYLELWCGYICLSV